MGGLGSLGWGRMWEEDVGYSVTSWGAKAGGGPVLTPSYPGWGPGRHTQESLAISSSLAPPPCRVAVTFQGPGCRLETGKVPLGKRRRCLVPGWESSDTGPRAAQPQPCSVLRVP